MQLNYKKIADMFGEGATYDAIEGRFRIIRKEAEKLKAEIETGERGPAPARGTGEKRSPRKQRRQHSVIDLDEVQTGRVTKSTQDSPSKCRSAARIKRELLEASASTSSNDDGGHSTFNSGDDEYLPVDADFSFNPTVMDTSSVIYNSFDVNNTNANTSMTMEGSGQWLDDFGEPEQYA